MLKWSTHQSINVDKQFHFNLEKVCQLKHFLPLGSFFLSPFYLNYPELYHIFPFENIQFTFISILESGSLVHSNLGKYSVNSSTQTNKKIIITTPTEPNCKETETLESLDSRGKKFPFSFCVCICLNVHKCVSQFSARKLKEHQIDTFNIKETLGCFFCSLFLSTIQNSFEQKIEKKKRTIRKTKQIYPHRV